MAITSADCAMWNELRLRRLIPDNPRVLEIGRANWYGDVDFREALPGIVIDNANCWELADLYYAAALNNPVRLSVDLDKDACEVRHDLNKHGLPRAVEECIPGFLPADIIINTGTTEHVFDQRQVWESIHDCCKIGGLMVHSMPLWGWLDHGFYNYQPTMIADIAAENGYEIVLWMFSELQPAFNQIVKCASDIHALYGRERTRGALMLVVFRRTSDEPFRVPMQGVYSHHSRSAK